ncbi:MAG: AAA family ATPase [Marinilabiliales bacterium]
MLNNHIIDLLEKRLEFTPTGSQKNAIKHIADYINKQDSNKVLIIKGYAGTGKTTLINALIKTLDNFNIRYKLMAPTGRAAKVISSYTGKNAYTIHKIIYRQKSVNDGIGKFELDFNKFKNTFFIVDEASMINNKSGDSSIFGSGNLLKDLLDYVRSGNNCNLIIIGDTAQLPPVGLAISPALDSKNFENEGFITEEHTLTDVIRQYNDSGILYNATILRNMIDSDMINPPKIKISQFDDIKLITSHELPEELESAYDKYGIENVIIITRSNKTANYYNQSIRNKILWKEDELCIGDRLMVVRNNYYWLGDNEYTGFIANGDILELQRIIDIEEKYGFRFANAIVSLPDYDDMEIEAKLLIDTLHSTDASLSANKSKELYINLSKSYSTIKNKKKLQESIINNPYYNAIQVKFAYSITCHRAQGGQWAVVFIDLSYFSPAEVDKEYLRWLYTAFTRPVEKLYLINFPINYVK